MAKSNEKKKKRVGIVQRMMFGDENKPDITPEQMKMSAWEQFKEDVHTKMEEQKGES